MSCTLCTEEYKDQIEIFGVGNYTFVNTYLKMAIKLAHYFQQINRKQIIKKMGEAGVNKQRKCRTQNNLRRHKPTPSLTLPMPL